MKTKVKKMVLAIFSILLISGCSSNSNRDDFLFSKINSSLVCSGDYRNDNGQVSDGMERSIAFWIERGMKITDMHELAQKNISDYLVCKVIMLGTLKNSKEILSEKSAKKLRDDLYSFLRRFEENDLEGSGSKVNINNQSAVGI